MTEKIPYVTILAVGFSPIVGSLIMLKNDKQMIHMLEGKLYRQGRDISIARQIYSSHVTLLSLVTFAVGLALCALGMITFVGNNIIAGVVIGTIGIGLAGWGVISRIGAFRAADRELDSAQQIRGHNTN